MKERPHQTLFWKNGSKWAVRDGDLKAVFGNSDGSKRNFHCIKLSATRTGLSFVWVSGATYKHNGIE